MPVLDARSARVISFSRRRARRRGPTATRTLSTVGSMGRVCHIGNRTCRRVHRARRVERDGTIEGERMDYDYDVVVIGGGAAGLSGAGTMAGAAINLDL